MKPTRRSALGGAAACLLASPALADDLQKAAFDAASAEASSLQRRADKLLRRLSHRGGSVGARLAGLMDDPRWLYPDDSAGRDRAVADMNAAVARLRPRLAAVFAQPSPVTQIRRMTQQDEAAARAGFREPDGYRVDLAAIRRRPAWTLASVAYHETVPGHALAPRADAVFGESWAIYAEQLAHDLGAYDEDPMGELGYLQWRLFRMARVVVDTGFAIEGWSDARAAQVMLDLQGRAIAFTTIEADIARIRSAPGVYAAQGVGALRLAKARPDDRRLWPAFHAKALQHVG